MGGVSKFAIFKVIDALELLIEVCKEFAEGPDWTFIRERMAQISFLFGDDDHWGPLQVLEEISKQVPGITVAVERENHTHGFSCTEAGSLWVAQHVANLIKNQTSLTMQ